MVFTPHTESDITAMLARIGVSDIDELYEDIPSELKLTSPLNIPESLSQPDLWRLLKAIGSKNEVSSKDLLCFAGSGSYDREISPVTRALAFRSEFVTSYTPYQAEVSQGILQALFEFQTLVSRLSGLPISNASLYDGAAALVEAVNMAATATKREKLIVSEGIFDNWMEVLKTFIRGTGHELVIAPIRNGLTSFDSIDLSNAAAIVSPVINKFGYIETLSNLASVCKTQGAKLVLQYDPVATSILNGPGQLGADIAIAEGQALCMPMAFGGPYLGLFSVTEDLVRLLPGRIVGKTLDLNGKTAYVTTLRTREQDIKRERATSNVCTNQTLMAIAFTVQLSCLGTQGIMAVAERSFSGAHYLRERLAESLSNFHMVAPERPFFQEFSIYVNEPDRLYTNFCEEGIIPGVIHYPTERNGLLKPCITICVTERRTKVEMDKFVEVAKKVIK